MLRIIFLGLFLFLIDYTALKSLNLVIQDWSELAQKIVIGVYWMIPVLAIGFFTFNIYGLKPSHNQQIITILRSFFILIYLGKIMIILSLLLDSLRLMLLAAYSALMKTEYDPSRSKFLAQIGIITSGIPLALLSYGIIRNQYRYKIWRHTLSLEHLPDGFEGLKIVQISDIHAGSFQEKEPIKKGIELINQEQADLVFFTGDLVNNVANEMNELVDIFKEIKAKHGVFSVTGNHDYGDYMRWESKTDKENNFLALMKQHEKMGWKLLMNEHKILKINNIDIAIIGIENYSGQARFSKYGSLPRAYEKIPKADFEILLSHDPSHWDAEVRKDFPNIDLTLSGHTHGFQFGIEIPGWFRWSPSKYFYKQWAGLYQEGKQYLNVNRGFGFLGYPGRVGILPEITVIEIQKKKNVKN
jgi:uncharacterized protein